jgi:hypothetical protein
MTRLVLDIKLPQGETFAGDSAQFDRLLSMAAVFYNTRLARYLCFLLLVVHFLPGRVDEPASPDHGDD